MEEAERADRLERMMEQYGADVLRLCCVYLRDAKLAEDAAQETFLKAYRSMDAFRGESGEKTWLAAIAVNVCRDWRRGAWFRHIDRSVDWEKLGLAAEAPKTAESGLMQAIMRLPRKQRAAVLMRYYADMTQSEMARTLHISEAAVSKRLTRAREMLKNELKGGMRDE